MAIVLSEYFVKIVDLPAKYSIEERDIEVFR